MQPHLLHTHPDLSTDALHRKAVTRVIETLRDRFDHPLSLDEMARIALISPYHFIRVFHRLTGIPPVRYQWAMRLAFAKRLLVETDMSVIDVCFEAGYSSLGSFTRRFTELVGMPPHHFRLAAQSFDRERLTRLLEPMMTQPVDALPAEVSGTVLAPAEFKGLIFVGLYPVELTQSLPVACCVLTSAGEYRISAVPDGRYRVTAAAIARSGRPAEFFLYDEALRAAAPDPITVRGGQPSLVNLILREPQLTDLPILAALVPLLQSKLEEVDHRTRHPAHVNGFPAFEELHELSAAPDRAAAAVGD
jgi:AraC family transcriptional regulator